MPSPRGIAVPGQAHRHGLQHLVLNTAGDPQRGHENLGRFEIRSYVGHPSGHGDAGARGQRLHGA